MEDKYLWLEEIEDEKALGWVKEKNHSTLSEFESLPDYKINYDIALSLYQTKDKIEYPIVEKDYIYNFWMDEVHVRGILRRTSLDSYLTKDPKWEIVLDVDELGKIENKSWVYKGMSRFPGSNKCLLSLSDGGKDAHYVREFDLDKLQFVQDGFNLPESKGYADWLNEDTLVIARNFGEDSLTDSGYPRIVKQLKRGQKINDAVEILTISKTDIIVWPLIQHFEDRVVEIYQKGLDFYQFELYLRKGNTFVKLNLPKRISTYCIFQKKLIFMINENWKNLSKGTVLSLDLEKILNDGDANPQVIMFSSESFNVRHLYVSKNALIVLAQEHIKSKIYECKMELLGWNNKKIDFLESGTISIIRSSSETDNYFFTYESFNQPTTLYHKMVGNQSITPVKSVLPQFDFNKIEVEQKFTISEDGTKIPYFIVYSKTMMKNGKNPTIIFGYGGFQRTKTPFFSNHLGKLWLEKGGVYVLANIRGGGEYGPNWHQAVLKKNRHKAYADFFAVAQDLINCKITTPPHLGCQGGSNGGLLMGVCLTQKPHLFNAIDCSVPLLDMLRFHKLLAGASWVAEYGSPENEDEREYLKSYSPYHNLKKDMAYPKILFTTSTKDDRVHPGHARKIAALMEELGHPFYYYENMEGGHACSADYSQYAKVTALSYSYFWKMLR